MTSILPSSDLPFKDDLGTVRTDWATDGGGLGDYDDILMLTTRNESKRFVGRAPAGVRPNETTARKFNDWTSENVESTLAEVVWFALENPEADSNANHFTGEPGMRTIYRRALLIAPWLNPYRTFAARGGAAVDTFTLDGVQFKAEPGLLRILPGNVKALDVDVAIAAVIAFQDRYDLSVRLEWDYNIGRWKIIANTLGDLTKRENRFGHFGFRLGSGARKPERIYPFPLVSTGGAYSGSQEDLAFAVDPEVGGSNKGKGQANISRDSAASASSYTIDKLNYSDPSRYYSVRPFVYVNKDSSLPATAQAVLNDDGAVVRVLHGPVPLWGARRGEDVMLTNVLAFDVRAFDPGAPIFKHAPTDTVLTPTDPGWTVAYVSGDNMTSGASTIGKNNSNNSVVYPFVGQGAYVDLGYGYDLRLAPPTGPGLPAVGYSSAYAASPAPWFFTARALSDVQGKQLAPGFAVYDTWSFHYENDGLNEDNDEVETATGNWKLITNPPVDAGSVASIDEGTNGLDDYGHYSDGTFTRLGVDDVGERETTPPYDKPLRGVQVLIRAYEPDSRAIRQVRVNQHFMPE
jgi:hypothetical protein